MRRPKKYLDELISYGGQPFTRAEVIADMQRDGTPQLLIDRWLQSQEHAARRHAQRESPNTSSIPKPVSTPQPTAANILASNSSPSKASSPAPNTSSVPSTSAT